MITAYDAYNQATSVQNQVHSEQLSKCELAIKKAIQRGDTSCYIYESLTDVVSKKLREAGYKVSFYSDQRDGSTTTISWSHADKVPDDGSWRR